MIYITGDLHRDIHVKKITKKYFPVQKELTRKDYLIITGDFGLNWDESKTNEYWKRFYENRNYTILFVDGNHEQFNKLNKTKVDLWNGGKVHFLAENIIHLMRGQIFNIDGFKFFTMGGAKSIDKEDRKENVNWWKEELPSINEINEGIKNLEKNNWSVDYVISHTVGNKIIEKMGYSLENNLLSDFFNLIEQKVVFKHWYFGHFHRDIHNIDQKHTVLFNTIIKL